MDNSNSEQPSFLGKGWSFPVTFLRSFLDDQTRVFGCPPDDESASVTVEKLTKGDMVKISSEIGLVEESLTILLATRPGERVMRPDYGCALDDSMFETANTSLITYLKDIISKSILYYEPRVQVREIKIDTAGILEGRILIVLDLILRSTNSRMNFVYDYYKKEGTIRPV